VKSTLRLPLAAMSALLGLAAAGFGIGWPGCPIVATVPLPNLAVVSDRAAAPQPPVVAVWAIRPAARRALAAARPVAPPPVPRADPSVQAEARPAELWQQWQRLLSGNALQQLPILNALLAESLRSHADAVVYGEISSLLGAPDLSLQAKSLLIDLLGEAATPEALQLLLEAASEGSRSPLYGPSLNTISHIGDNHWGGRFHEELSAVLEQAWSGDIGEAALVRAITRAIVAVGSPSGIQMLLDTLAGRGSVDDSMEVLRSKQIAVFKELPKVSNPAAMSTLVANLRGGSRPLPAGSNAARNPADTAEEGEEDDSTGPTTVESVVDKGLANIEQSGARPPEQAGSAGALSFPADLRAPATVPAGTD